MTPCVRARASPRSRSAVPPCLQSPRPPRIANTPPSTSRACWRLSRARRPQRRCHRALRSRATRPRASEARTQRPARALRRPTRRVHLALRSRRTGNHSYHQPRRHRSPHALGMCLRPSPRPHSICSRSCHSTRTLKSEPLSNPQTAFLFLHGLGEAAVHYLGETVPMLRACLPSLHSPCIATLQPRAMSSQPPKTQPNKSTHPRARKARAPARASNTIAGQWRRARVRVR